MNLIRDLIYGIGIRPKPGSIFYSPSRAFSIGARKGIEEWSK